MVWGLYHAPPAWGADAALALRPFKGLSSADHIPAWLGGGWGLPLRRKMANRGGGSRVVAKAVSGAEKSG